jgi:hypothetical protein
MSRHFSSVGDHDVQLTAPKDTNVKAATLPNVDGMLPERKVPDKSKCLQSIQGIPKAVSHRCSTAAQTDTRSVRHPMVEGMSPIL